MGKQQHNVVVLACIKVFLRFTGLSHFSSHFRKKRGLYIYHLGWCVRGGWVGWAGGSVLLGG